MKKIAKSLLVFVCLIASQMAWAADVEMNIYVNKFDVKVDRTTRLATISFEVAAPAKGVVIKYDSDNDGNFETEVYNNSDYTIPRNGKFEYSYQIPINNPGGVYNWSAKVTGAPAGNNPQSAGFNNATTNVTPKIARDYENKDNRYKFQYPKALTIQTSYSSPLLGYSFVGEAGSLTNLTANNGRTGSSQGIYKFGPSMGVGWSSDDVTKAPYGAYTSTLTWMEHQGDRYAPYRISIDKDDYVYICHNFFTADNANRIWRVHANDLKKDNAEVAFNCIMTTSTLEANGLHQRVLAMSVGEIDEYKVLYVISGYTENAIITKAQISGWKINEQEDGTCVLELLNSLSLLDIKYGDIPKQKLKSPHCSVVPGNENGDIWIFQQADTTTGTDKNTFAAIHLTPSGGTWIADYRIPSIEHHNISGTGAIGKCKTYKHDNEKKEEGLYYLAMPSILENNEGIKVFRMYKDDKGLHRAHTYTIQNPEKPKNGFGEGDAVAIDIANNLYFTSSTSQRLYVYALPKADNHTVKTQHDVPYTVTWNRNGITEDYTSAPTYNYMYSSDFVPTLGKEGYKFHGWYEDPNFSGTPVTSINKNTTLHARWTKLEIYEDNATANQTVLEDDVNGYHGSVWVYRKLQGEMFSTLCLPFDITTDILNKATNSAKTSNPLSGATLWTFSSVSTEGDGTKILHFKPTDTVTANTPFLIEPTDDIAEEIFFHGVTISKPTNYQAAGTVTHDGITFTGVINPIELAAGSNTFFLVSDNRLAIPAAGGATLGGLRGYFTNPSGARLAIRTQQNTPTLLESVNCNIKNTYKILQDGKIYIIRDGVMYDIKGYRL